MITVASNELLAVVTEEEMPATKNAHDWHCQDHDIYGWKGEECRLCPKSPSEADYLRDLCCQLYEAERDKNQQNWTAVIRALEKVGADMTANVALSGSDAAGGRSA